MKAALTGLVALALGAPAVQAQFPTEPPTPGPVLPFPLTPAKEALLPNGLRLMVLEQPRQPVLSLSLALPAGTAFDPNGKEGTADLFGRLLTRGAGARDAAQLASAIETVGGSLGATTDPDLLSIQADVLSAHAQLAFDLVADLILRPRLDSTELESARQVVLATLATEPGDGAAIAGRAFLAGTYRQHPYARRPTSGSISRITRADLEAFRQARVRPGGSVLVVAGDITLADAQRLATRALGGWKGVRPAALPAIVPTPAPRTIYLVHRGGAQTADIILGNTTFIGSDTSYLAAAVLNRVLGEGPDSRLPRSLGEGHGWSLATGSSFQRTARLGLFQATAEVRPQVVDSALGEMLAQLKRLATDLVPARELDRARESLAGEFPLRLQTVSELAAALSQAKMFGVPASYITGYRARIAKVQAPAVRAVARRVFDPEKTTIVVAGDAARLYQPLSALGPTRIFAVNGRPLTPEEVKPIAGRLALDVSRLAPRTDSMVVLVQGRTVGLQVAEIARGGDSVVYTERTALGPQLNQVTRLVFDSAGRMRRLDQTGKVRGQDTRIALTYGAGRVRGQAQVIGGDGRPQSFTVDTSVAPGIIDDNGLVALLPTLPWALNTRWTIPIFGSGENRTRTVTLTVADIEQTVTPAGAFETYRADLEGASQAVSFYVTTSRPHRLVRITLTGSPVEFLAITRP